jgi:hypothetical protein
MQVQEQIADRIFHFNEELSKFIQHDEEVSKEFNAYAQAYQNNFTRDALAYFIFDKKLENGKKVIDAYIEKNSDLTKDDIKILENFKHSINSTFQVKKVLKDGFEVYNLVNEKDYTIKSLIKMVNYRGVLQGHYLVCRLLPYENEYHLLVLSSVIPSADRNLAYRTAVSMQIENPETLYLDNPEKLKAIEELIVELNGKFKEFFGKTEIITINKRIDEILGAFNDYAEEGTPTDNIEEMIEAPEKYTYFKVNEDVDPFDLNAKREDKEVYDVGIVFDPELGIQVLPFYGTFKQIFEADDYKSIEGYKDCILDYFTNGKVPPYIFKQIYDKCGDKFVNIAAEVLELNEKTDFDSLMQKYKEEFFVSKKFSSTTVLYASEAFSGLMSSAMEVQMQDDLGAVRVGRNDPCPCGSGKKFKKCCAK